MENRITLQYSVEESQLKFEAHRLVSNAIARLNSIVCDEPLAASIISMSTVHELTSLRKELASIDILLSDASVIIENYIDYKHQQKLESISEVSNASSDMANLEQLQNKIQNFKDKIGSHENAD
tara:strand:+ start:640 stop:1011 length:372 start_codon:yes stop_codon:yes gene_type:complete